MITRLPYFCQLQQFVRAFRGRATDPSILLYSFLPLGILIRVQLNKNTRE